MENSIGKFIKDQLSVWPLAAENYRNLKRVRTKTVDVGGLGVTIQYNPCRKISSEASLDKESIASLLPVPGKQAPGAVQHRSRRKERAQVQGHSQPLPDIPFASGHLKYRAHPPIDLAPLPGQSRFREAEPGLLLLLQRTGERSLRSRPHALPGVSFRAYAFAGKGGFGP